MKTLTKNAGFLKFKALFESERKRILSRTIIDEAAQVQAEDIADEVDLTVAELSASMQVRMRHRESLYLKKIEESLLRISDGTFGFCEGCEEPIEAKRLEARPTAVFCLECKEAQERLENHHVDGQRHKSLGKKLRFA